MDTAGNGPALPLPLPLLLPGQTACVQRVRTGAKGMARKLSAMGIAAGTRVTVLNAQSGPLLLRVGESRYAIGRGMAQRIMVVPCQEAETCAADPDASES